MHSAEYDRMYSLEDSYWWFVARQQLALRYVPTPANTEGNLRILDVGCGTGAFSALLRPRGDVISADFSPLALNYCMRRGLRNLCACDIMRLPFQDESFDLVVALDILEHVPYDGTAAFEIHRVLKPGGRLITTVPAYRSLWSQHDEALMHFRRYTAGEFRRLIADSGLRVRKLSYAMTLLYPVVWAVRRLRRRKHGAPSTDLIRLPQIVNSALTTMMQVDSSLVQRLGLPFGVTVFCVADRP